MRFGLPSGIVAATLAVLLPVGAQAADRIKVGFISTLSGPSAALGVDIRDGFQLAVKMAGGRIGGLPAEVLVGDDQFKPDVGRQLAEKNVRLDKVNFLTGRSEERRVGKEWRSRWWGDHLKKKKEG